MSEWDIVYIEIKPTIRQIIKYWFISIIYLPKHIWVYYKMSKDGWNMRFEIHKYGIGLKGNKED